MNHQPLIKLAILLSALAWSSPALLAQVNSGSNGSDGAFTPLNSTNINMADHPDGIYHFTSVFIQDSVTVTFTPNSNNAPVIWLVQSNCTINGAVNISGQNAVGGSGGAAGPGGFRGGNAGTFGTGGQGPGGGAAVGYVAGSGSYGTLGTNALGTINGAGSIYGSQFLIPLLGGSGGAGSTGFCDNHNYGGGGGAGALLIAASGEVRLNGWIFAHGGPGCGLNANCGTNYSGLVAGGDGSGGAVRLVASRITGSGTVHTGRSGSYCGTAVAFGGLGRVRLDSPDLNFGGVIVGTATQGYQPIIIPVEGAGVQLAIESVAGVPVSASPTGQVSTPDAIIAAFQTNSIPIVVRCANIPLNTSIAVNVRPVSGSNIFAVGQNTSGTFASSTATVMINVPRGGGVMYATLYTGL